MTASVITERPAAAPVFGRFAGLRALVRKDATEWMRGRRAWIVFIIATLWTVLAAANAWIIMQARDLLPADVEPEALPASLAPMDNLLAGFGSQVFVLAAVFAVASLIVRERESGTLAWVASKPVSREAIWLSKWLSSSVMLAVAAVVAPLVLTVAAVVAMYGMPDPGAVTVIGLGGIAAVVFYAALGLEADEIGADVAVALGRLHRRHAGKLCESHGRCIVGTAEGDSQPILRETAQQVRRGGGPHETAVVEDRDLVADPLDVVEDVRRVEDSRLSPELGHEVEDLTTTDRVEGAHRLVEQDDARSRDECLGDAEALAHATRVGLRLPVGGARQPDPCQHLADPGAVGGRGVVRDRCDELERLATGHPVVEAGVLREIADLAPVGRAFPSAGSICLVAALQSA